MAFIEEEKDSPMLAQRKADHSAAVEREHARWKVEFDKMYGNTKEVVSGDELKKIKDLKFKKIPDLKQGKENGTAKKELPKIKCDEEYFSKLKLVLVPSVRLKKQRQKNNVR